MFAAYHHRAVAHEAAVRKKLGVRTLFNVLGPLANPAGARRQLMGVFDRALTAPLAAALGSLGAGRAWVVAGSNGLDELTTTGPSYVSETKFGATRDFTINPEEAGLVRARPEALKGGDPERNAAALRDLLAGERGPYRDIVLLNSAAALIVADKATTLPDGVTLAARSIDDESARRALDRLVAITNEPQHIEPLRTQRARSVLDSLLVRALHAAPCRPALRALPNLVHRGDTEKNIRVVTGRNARTIHCSIEASLQSSGRVILCGIFILIRPITATCLN